MDMCPLCHPDPYIIPECSCATYYTAISHCETINLSDCVPDASAFEPESDMAKLCYRMKKMLQEAEPPPPPSYMADFDDSHVKDTLRALGVRVGEKVVVGGVKVSLEHFIGFCQKRC